MPSRSAAKSYAASTPAFRATPIQDAAGKWQGLDVALCRAVAAAMLGDPEKVKYIGTTSKVRFSVLQSGEIDLLVRDFELTLDARFRARPRRGHVQFLHGPDHHGAQEPECRARQGSERGDRLSSDRHNARDEHRRLQPGKQHQDRHAACSSGPRRPSRRPRPGGATATPMTAAASRPRAQPMKKPDDWIFLPEVLSRQPLGSAHPTGRRPLDRHREMDPFRDARSRGARHHQGQCRRDRRRHRPIRR